MQIIMKRHRRQRRYWEFLLQWIKWSLWLTCGAAFAWIGWNAYKSSHRSISYGSTYTSTSVPAPVDSGPQPKAAQPPSTPSRLAHPRTVVSDFPANPELWPVAANELLDVDPRSASRILTTAAEGCEDGAPIFGDAAIACLLAGDGVRASRALSTLSDKQLSDWHVEMAEMAAAAVAARIAVGPPVPDDYLDIQGTLQQVAARERRAFVRAGARFLVSASETDENAAQPLIDLAGSQNTWQLDSERLLAAWLSNTQEAMVWAQHAADLGGAPQDWIRYAILVARSGGDPGPVETKASIACRASTQAARYFAGWLAIEGRQEEALAWIKGLPLSTRSDTAINDLEATLDCRLGKADALRAALAAGAWGRLKPEAAEYAFATLLMAHRNDGSLDTQMWGKALDVTRDDLDSMVPLLRLAETSGMRAATLSTFAAILAAPRIGERTAIAGTDSNLRQRDFAWRFYTFARQQGDDELTQRAAKAWLDADPNNPNAQLAWSHVVLCRADPTNLASAVAQVERLSAKRSELLPLLAYARHVEGRDDDAILILSRVSQQQLSPDGLVWVQTAAGRLANVFDSAPP
jgi:hypothetical protein